MDRHRAADVAGADRSIGRFLVYHDELDALVNPKRWTVCGPQLALSPSQYIAACIGSACDQRNGDRHQISALNRRIPSWCWRANRSNRGAGGARACSASSSIPPTGAVLDKVDFRASLVGFLHVFHENLTIPQYSGRQIVGWAGVGMLDPFAHRHLAVVAASGIAAARPSVAARAAHDGESAPPSRLLDFDTARDRVADRNLSVVPADGSLADVVDRSHAAAAAARFAAAIVEKPNLSPDEALRLAQAVEPAARPATLFLPTEPNRRPAAKAAKAARAPNAGRPKRVARHARAARKAARDAKRRRGARHHRHRGACNCAMPPRPDHGHCGRPKQRRAPLAGSAGRQSRGAVDPMDP